MIHSNRILLVEDNDKDAELFLSVLDEKNCFGEVDRVRDGEEALKYLRYQDHFQGRAKINPILILLDIKMPKINGLEALKTIKSDDQLKTIPAVMFTSSREEKDVAQSYCAGANAYVVKPVEFSDFVKVVQGVTFFWTGLNEPLIAN